MSSVVQDNIGLLGSVVIIWIISTSGFWSAVQDPNDAERLVVRSRDRQSLQAMIESIQLAGAAAGDPGGPDYQFGDIVTGEGTDYRWRVRVSKATFAHFMSYELMNSITYPNFKSALKKSRGQVWADAASNVWIDMLKVDDGPKDERRAWDLSGAPEPSKEDLEALVAAFPEDELQ